MTKDDKTFKALTQRLGEMVKENVELAERVRQLMSDYNNVVKQLQANPVLSQLTEALDKVKKLERDRDLFYKEYEHGQRLYESLFNQYDAQNKELKTVREAFEATKKQYNELQRKCTVLHFKHDAVNVELQKAGDTLKQLQDDKALLREQLDIANANCKKTEEERDEAKEQYNDLQQKYEELSQQLNTANSKYKCADKRLDEADEEYYTLSSLLEGAESRIARFEKSTFERMEHDCPYGVKAIVGTLACFNCEHYIKYDFGNTKTVLCAHDYDKEKEKQQEIEKKTKIKNHNEN